MRARQSALILVLLVCGAAATLPPRLGAQAPSPAAAPVSARTWIGHAAEIENYLRTVPILKLQDLSVGVTHPRKATLPPGGPMQYLAWKVIPPARYEGFWESYLSEIAAYEMDKLLELNMVPPTVEREYHSDRGAAVMWCSPTKSFKELGGKGAPEAPPAYAALWARQIARAKMFDNLINNLDPNLGNWLVDPAWNLILIDFSRCFTPGRNMEHELTRVDADLWDRMKALTDASITQAIGKLIGTGERKAILQRRDRMQEIIDKLVKERGAAYVFMRGG